MWAILTVFRKECRENLRDRRTVIAALIMGPLFGPLLFGAGLSLSIRHGDSEGERTITVAVSHGERAPNLLNFLRQYGVTVKAVDLDDAGARRAVNQRRYPLVLDIAGDFGARLAGGEPASVAVYADASDNSSSRDVVRVRTIVSQYGVMLAHLRAAARGLDPLLLTPVVIQDLDVSTPASRSVVALGTLSYLILLTMLMGGMYLAIDATAGERERGSLEPLLTVPVRRQHLIYGKILATCAYMSLSLVLTVSAFSIVLRSTGLERFGMSVNFGPLIAFKVAVGCLPLVPLGAALMTIVASFTRSYREAQTYLGLILLIPTLPLVFAGAMGLRATPALMAVPSLSQHFLIISLLRDEPVSPGYLASSVGVTLALGSALTFIAGRLYRREALLG